MSATGDRIRVLVADDDAGVRQAVADIVSDEPGLELVGTAADGYEAIEQARQTKPHVALVDIVMPLGGVETTRALVAEHPGIHVIIFSAQADRATRRAVKDAGARGFIAKGSGADLIDAVWQLVGDGGTAVGAQPA